MEFSEYQRDLLEQASNLSTDHMPQDQNEFCHDIWSAFALGQMYGESIIQGLAEKGFLAAEPPMKENDQ